MTRVPDEICVQRLTQALGRTDDQNARQVEGSHGGSPTITSALMDIFRPKLTIATLTAFSVALSFSLLLSGCDLREPWILGSPTFYPTALDYWPDEKAFLVGSYHDGSIQRMAFDGNTVFDPFQEKHANGRQRALRIKVDKVRNRLWVLDVDGVYVYALPDKSLLSRVDLPWTALSKEECLPDIALDSSTGAAYISDNRRPIIYLIDQELNKESLRKTAIPVRFERGERHDGGFSALSVIDAPYALIAGSASTGELWRIDATTGEARMISLPRSMKLKGVCGMSLVVPARPYSYLPLRPQIYVTTGFHNQVIKIRLTPDLQRGDDVARIASLMAVQTPISLIAFKNYTVVTSSQLGRHKDFNGGNDPLVPFRLVLMPTG